MMDYPHYILPVTVADSDLDYTGRASVAKLCDVLQKGATASAAELGVGLTELLKDGHSWMMTSLSVVFARLPRRQEKITLTTWPSGVKGKLICYRDYKIDGEDGETIVRGVADWVYVDIVSRRVCRLTPHMLVMAPEGVPRVDIEPRERRPEVAGEPMKAEIGVRRADVDINHHVNNVHYVEWLFEPLTPELYGRRLARLDITYRAEALYGDSVESLAWLAEDGAKTVHELRRKSDGQLLTEAVCAWAD